MNTRIQSIILILMILLSLIGINYLAGMTKAARRTEFSVHQDGQCHTVTPLGNGSNSVQDFYDYRNNETDPYSDKYSSFGTNPYQKNQVSNLFLYRGSNGLNLVFLHDKLGTNDSHSSTITMNISGLPAGSWVVRDDWYGRGRQDDNWGRWGNSGSGNEIDWMWAPGRTDGGAYQGLENLGLNDTIRITPRFNERATYWEQWPFSGGNNRTQGWQLISADGQVVSLDMDTTITIQAGSCNGSQDPTTSVFLSETHGTTDRTPNITESQQTTQTTSSPISQSSTQSKSSSNKGQPGFRMITAPLAFFIILILFITKRY
ncbi:hypothetical protein [Haladaptatus litoreus]|nr:hypothetical protein [Haladaptatus litoreus]